MATDVVKRGYMRIKGRSFGVWQKRWIVLRSNSSSGPTRFEKYGEEMAENVDQPKVQLLNNVCEISRLTTRRHAFIIHFHDGTSKSFACGSELEADNWVKATQESISSGISNEPDVLVGIQKELQFRVYLMPSKLDFFGECLLQVTPENIYIKDMIHNKTKLAWPLVSLRRYGSDSTKFTFEAGRHCVTGEGFFVFHTSEGEKIYRKVHQSTLAIAQAHQKMKNQAISSLCNEENLKNTLEHKVASLKADLEATFNEISPEQTSWYNSDNESDVTVSASEVYNHRHLESQFAAN